MTLRSAQGYFSLAELTPGRGDSGGYHEPEEVRRTEGRSAGVVERRVFLGRSVICAVSQPGHIAVGGISTGSPQRHKIRNNRTMRTLSNVHKDEQGRTTCAGRSRSCTLAHPLTEALGCVRRAQQNKTPQVT